jgi:hypothetical protein
LFFEKAFLLYFLASFLSLIIFSKLKKNNIILFLSAIYFCFFLLEGFCYLTDKQEQPQNTFANYQTRKRYLSDFAFNTDAGLRKKTLNQLQNENTDFENCSNQNYSYCRKYFSSVYYPKFGYVEEANTHNKIIHKVAGERIFDYSFKTLANSKGARYVKDNPESNDVLLFLGCSYMFGYGLKDEDTLAYQVSKLNNFSKKIINYSMAGKGAHHVLYTLENDDFVNKALSEKDKVKNVYVIVLQHWTQRVLGHFHKSPFGPKYIATDTGAKYSGKTIKSLRMINFERILRDSKLFYLAYNNYINSHKIKSKGNKLLRHIVWQIDQTVKQKYDVKPIFIYWNDYDQHFVQKNYDFWKQKGIDVTKASDIFGKVSQDLYIKNNIHPNKDTAQKIGDFFFEKSM